jgi:putative ABC transport system permease protein
MQWKVSRGTTGFFCKGSLVDSTFLQMFSFPLEEGNLYTALSCPNSMLISRSLAHKIFGNNSALGQTLALNDRPGMMVTGVYSDIPKTSHIQFDFATSFQGSPDWMRMWDRKCVHTYVLLNENASMDNVNKKISNVMNIHNPTWKNILFLFPVTKSHLFEPGGGGPIIYLYIFSTFGFLILLVACINFMNLTTARSEKRMKEIGVKKTIGSSRMELLQQFMAESLLLSFVSLLVALILIELSLPGLNDLLGTQISLNFSGRMILILAGITILTGLLAGSYPAIYLSSLNPMSVLGGRTTHAGTRRSSLIRNILVIVQFSFSVFVITCVLVVGKQMNFIRSKSLGFNKEQVLMISTRGDLQKKVTLAKHELLKLPFIQSATVTATNFTNFIGSGTGPIDWEGKNTDKIIEVGFNYVDEDFANTFQIKMTQGMFFPNDYATNTTGTFVVNEAAIKEMGITDPINKQLTTWFGMKGRIIGVIQDFQTQSLRSEMAPIVLIPTQGANYLYLRLTTTNIAAAIQSIETKVKEIVPDDPFEFRFLDDVINEQYIAEQRTDKLATLIAVLSIFVSCLGLFGLASFSSEQRTKEIGVRKVLGASAAGLLLMLTKDFTKWVFIANMFAWPVAWYAVHKWLQNFAYRIEVTWWIFLVAGGITLLIALLTVSYKAIRVATANPVEALRYE